MSQEKDAAGASPPSATWPEFRGWRPAGVNHPVFRATSTNASSVYVRADDGSGPLLRRLEREPDVPAPRLLDRRAGWLLLEALPGAPLNDDRWLARPADAVPIINEALRCLARSGITHGDMCLPNILGDVETGELSGIVDWHYAGQFDREIDVASAIWSCEYNGYPPDVPVAVLESLGWPRQDSAEVERLGKVWIELAGPP
jgi:phosphotransferase family enzyme